MVVKPGCQCRSPMATRISDQFVLLPKTKVGQSGARGRSMEVTAVSFSIPMTEVRLGKNRWWDRMRRSLIVCTSSIQSTGGYLLRRIFIVHETAEPCGTPY